MARALHRAAAMFSAHTLASLATIGGLVALSGLNAGCANAIAPYGTDPAAYRAQVAPMVAEANARQATGMGQITAAALSGVQPIATRPFTAAPKVPGAPGFHCYSKRKLSTQEDDSACARTIEDCRAMAKRDAKGGAYDVGHCQRQDTATCQYLWSSETEGTHRCFAAPSDCRPFMMSAGVLAQSECGTAR